MSYLEKKYTTLESKTHDIIMENTRQNNIYKIHDITIKDIRLDNIYKIHDFIFYN